MEQQKTIQEYSETELKALAYDQIAVKENANTNLQIINDELRSRQSQPVTSLPIQEEAEPEAKKQKK